MSDFDYLELAMQLSASVEKKEDECFKNAPAKWEFKIAVDEMNFNLVAQDDSNYHVKEGMIRFWIYSRIKDKHGEFHHTSSLSINVSAKKSPAQVATEIRRRLLNPETVEQIREFQESVRRMEERTDAKIKMMEQAAQLIQSPKSVGPNTEKIWTGDNFPVQFVVSNWLDDQVKIDSLTLTIEQLEKVCKALQ